MRPVKQEEFMSGPGSGGGDGSGPDCGPIGRRLEERARIEDPGTRAIGGLSADDLRHLAGCGACRVRLAEADPAALFSLLVLERKDDAFWTGFETRVLARIREAEREPSGWLARLFRPRSLAVLACSAAAILSVFVLTRTGAPHPGGPEGARAVLPGIPPTLPPDLIARADGGPLLPLGPHDIGTPSPVESVLSSTARIISIKVEGAANGDSRTLFPGAPTHQPSRHQDGADLVLIVDQRIDI